MASKFKVKLKITGFELELEGSREDVAELTHSVGEQMSGLLRPGGAIIEGTVMPVTSPPQDSVARLSDKRPRKRRAASPSGSDEAGEALDFRHDPSTHGMPRQDWKTAQKATWLLHVLKVMGLGDSFSTRRLVDTFNKHFKQSGMITTSNVTRDLGKAKVNETPSPVGEDTTKTPSEWYLTQEGEKRAAEMIAEGMRG